MKVTMVHPDKNKDFSFFYSIILFVLGIVLIFNSDGLISLIFEVLGAIVLIFGVFQFIRYYQLKKQFQVEDGSKLMTSVFSILVGLFIILLSSFLSTTIQVVTGVWLSFLGLSKMNQAFLFKNRDSKRFVSIFVSACVLILLGLYTILSDNVVMIFLGIILICYTAIDIMNYFMRK